MTKQIKGDPLGNIIRKCIITNTDPRRMPRAFSETLVDYYNDIIISTLKYILNKSGTKVIIVRSKYSFSFTVTNFRNGKWVFDLVLSNTNGNEAKVRIENGSFRQVFNPDDNITEKLLIFIKQPPAKTLQVTEAADADPIRTILNKCLNPTTGRHAGRLLDFDKLKYFSDSLMHVLSKTAESVIGYTPSAKAWPFISEFKIGGYTGDSVYFKLLVESKNLKMSCFHQIKGRQIWTENKPFNSTDLNITEWYRGFVKTAANNPAGPKSFLDENFDRNFTIEPQTQTLGHLCQIGTNMPDADFWLTRKGSRKTVGTPTKTFKPEHIGIKVTHTHILLPNYLFYMMQYLQVKDVFGSVATGILQLVHITVKQVKAIPIKSVG